jgi:hypothetical protein
MITHLSKLALTIVGDRLAKVIISNVSEGVNESTSFGYSKDTEAIVIEDSQELQYVDTHTIEIVGLKNDDMTDALLAKYNDPNAKAMVSAYGPDMTLVSVEPVKVEVIDHFDNGPFWKMRITKKTKTGRETTDGRKAGGLFVGKNMLGMYYWGTTVAGIPETPKGWSLVGDYDAAQFRFSSPSVAQQEIDISSGTGEFVFDDQLFLPFENEGFGGIFTLAMKFSPDAYNSDWTVQMGVEAYEEDGTAIDLVSTTVTQANETLYVAMPNGNPNRYYYLKPYVRWSGGSDDVTITIREPMFIAGKDPEPEFTIY